MQNEEEDQEDTYQTSIDYFKKIETNYPSSRLENKVQEIVTFDQYQIRIKSKLSWINISNDKLIDLLAQKCFNQNRECYDISTRMLDAVDFVPLKVENGKLPKVVLDR